MIRVAGSRAPGIITPIVSIKLRFAWCKASSGQVGGVSATQAPNISTAVIKIPRGWPLIYRKKTIHIKEVLSDTCGIAW